VLFGGRDAAGDLGDTWEFTGSGWSQVGGVGPSARSGAAMAGDGSTAVLFGGQTTTSILGDTWTFSGGVWSNYGVTPEQASAELHAIKAGAEGNPDVIFTYSGGVYDATSGDYLGSLVP
jgi:hypothetical protein